MLRPRLSCEVVYKSVPIDTSFTVQMTTEFTCFCTLLKKHGLVLVEYMNDKVIVVFFIAQQSSKLRDKLFLLVIFS